MKYELISVERFLSTRHDYAISYYDNRGAVVKMAKHLFPYVDVSTDKDTEIILSSTVDQEEENYIHSLFSPQKFSVKKVGNEDLHNYFQICEEWNTLIQDQLGLEGHLDNILASHTVKIKLDDTEDIPTFLKNNGFNFIFPNNNKILRCQFDSLILGDDGDLYSFSFNDINENTKNQMLEIEIMKLFDIPDDYSIINLNFFKEIFSTLEKQLVTLNILGEV